jgi:hypothetical protein
MIDKKYQAYNNSIFMKANKQTKKPKLMKIRFEQQKKGNLIIKE